MLYEDYAAQANKLLDERSFTRASLAAELGISRGKLDSIAKECSIPKYPRPLSASQAASYGVKSGKIRWGKRFKLRGSP